MTAVFSHGRLRLYLLKLLSERPRHGYELIRSLEQRFQGRYAPSAGTVYPRLQRLEADGLLTCTAAGSRKVYEITAAGRAELSTRAAELEALEREIQESLVGPGAREPRRRDPAAELEQRAIALLVEVQRHGAAAPERLRAAVVVLDTALDQVRRLLR